MKAMLILGCFVLLAGCGKKVQPKRSENAAVTTPPASLEQWTGRTDYTEASWKIKTQQP